MSRADITYDRVVGRWEPDARGRLEEAALELCVSRGYEQTTVAEIAAQAGLTERTFFRYFGDKREVLFGGSDVLRELLVDSLADAPPDAPTVDAVAAALGRVAPFLEARKDRALRRQTLIAAHPELQERELGNFATLA